jgi:hypothetical protein
LTASGEVPAVELALTMNVPSAAALADSFTIIFIAKLAPGARIPVEKVPFLTAVVTFAPFP